MTISSVNMSNTFIRYINFGVQTRESLVFKHIKLDEITKAVNVNRKNKRSNN